MLAYVVCRLCCSHRVWRSRTNSRRETRGAGRSGNRCRRCVRKRRQVSSIPYVDYDWSQVRLNIKFARLRDCMRRYTEGLRETIDWSHVACRFTVRLAYYQTLLIDETGMGMRPGQCGMCWSMRYRGGRLATERCRGDTSGLVGYGCWLPWWTLRTVCCGAISPNLLSVRPHEFVWANLSLIPLANLVVVRGGYILGWYLDWSRPRGFVGD